MNKEDIEKVKKHYIFTTEHELDDDNKTLKEYIEYLEQKEFILDKVKEIAKYFDTTENTIRTAIARKSKRNCRYIIIKVAD